MTDAALTPDEQARFDALYGSTPPAAAPDGPGVFTGAYKGLAGIPSGLAGAPLSAASAATGMPSIDAGYLGSLGVDPEQFKKDAQDYFSTTWQYAVHAPIEQLRQDAADYYRPDPQTTGFVGNTLFGAADVLTRVGVGNLIAPGAGLPLAAGTTAYERTQDLEGQGVDATTAQASGALTGASLLASGGLSAFGTTAIMRALTGAGLNAGFGAGTRALDSSILDAHGYTAQADQQRWSDAASVAADLIIGGAFHLLPTRGEGAPAKPAAEAVDAALTAKAAQGVTDSAPGVPADPRSVSAHVTALDMAQAQLVDGQAVAVDPIVRDATFAPRPEEPGVPLGEAFAEAGVPAEQLRQADASAAEAALRQRLESNPDQLFAEYAALPDSMGGVVLNTDVARELSPEYLANRTRSADVHEPASETIKRLYAKKLAEPTPEGMDPVVLFTAGGTGAGKSRSLSTETKSTGLRPEIVYDTNMNTYASAEKKVQQALDAGRQVRILYVYRDPVDALVNGALPRAERQALKYGTGRTVPLAEHARTHVGVRDVMERLAEKYAGDDRVTISARDNSGMPDKAPLRALADIPRPEQNGLHEKLAAALDAEHRAGRISDATRAGFEAPGRDGLVRAVRGEPAAQRPAGAPGRSGDAAVRDSGQPHTPGVGEHAAAGNPEAGSRSPQGLTEGTSGALDGQASAGAGRADGGAGQAQPRDTAAGGAPDAGARLDPARDGDVALARQIAAEHPDLVLDDGTTAADALRAADQDVQEAQRQAEGIGAAVACFLRFGADA